MKKELSKKLTEIYSGKDLHGYEGINDAIDNLEAGLVVVVYCDGVEVFSSIDDAVASVPYLQDEKNLTTLEKSGVIDVDDLNIQIIRN